MITEKQEKSINLLSDVSQTLLAKINNTGIPDANLLSLAYFNLDENTYTHGTTCKEWGFDNFKYDILNTKGLADVIKDKYDLVSSTGWEDAARDYFKNDPKVNADYPDIAKFVKVKSGYIGVCLKAKGIKCNDEKTLHQLCYEGLHMLKSIDKSRIEHAAIEINSENLTELRKNYADDTKMLEEKEKIFNGTCSLNRLPSLFIDGIKLSSKELLIVHALTECWSTEKREINHINRSAVSTFKNKIKNQFGAFDDFIRFLKFRNIL
jgi:hypothetical protein